MCGITGFAGFEDKALLKKMTDVIRHRGPDDDGYYTDRHVSLGNRRLSIIDISGSKQPVFNQNRDMVIVYNGEVYNFRQLRQELQQSGHKFYTEGDAEVVLHLYEEHGEQCVTMLNGMFAFAIWDARNKKLFLARDRAGIKPLYYTQLGSRFLFGSEIKSILQCEDVKREADMEAIDSYLTFRYVPGPKTLFKDIFKLMPGHTLTLHQGRFDIKKYWSLEFRPGNESEDYYAKKLRQLMEDSVRKRLISDVPLGAYLSGGLDSSFVVGLMSKLMDRPVNTFTVTFDDIEFNEAPFARKTAESFGTNHRTLKVREKSIDILPSVIWHMDEPVSDPAAMPTYMISELTKRHVTVVLTGEGSDELFGGYPQYRAAMLDRKIGPLRKFVPALSKNDIMKRFRQDYVNWISVFTESEKRQLLLEQPAEADKEIKRPYMLDNILAFDIKQWLPDDLLIKVDKNTMAHSVEARVPFLDHRMIEFAATIPSKYKAGILSEKKVLRKAMQGLVPKDILNRKKQGFHVPVENWIGGELRDIIHNMLSEPMIERRGYFNSAYVKKLLVNYNMSKKYYSRQLWNLFVLELWHRIFVDCENIKKPEKGIVELL